MYPGGTMNGQADHTVEDQERRIDEARRRFERG